MSHPFLSENDIDPRHGELYEAGFDSEKRAAVQFSGVLQATSTGHLMLSVPMSLVRGLHDALDAPGVSLPHSPGAGLARAGIVVMTPGELTKIGGPAAVTERGRSFRYTLGSIRETPTSGWPGVSSCWHVEVRSPELAQLRKTYGLHPKLEGLSGFSIIVGCRRTGVLSSKPVSKVVTAETYDPWPWQQLEEAIVAADSLQATQQLRMKAAEGGDWYVGNSDIQGQGIFAGRDYDKDERVGPSLHLAEKDFFGDKVWDLTLLGRKCNHQNAANARVELDGDTGWLVTTQPVKQDEEFTADYRQVGRELGARSRLRWEGRDMPSAAFDTYVELAKSQEVGDGRE